MLGTIASRVVIVWRYNNTGGNLLSATVAHAMINVSDALLPGYSHNGTVALVAVLTTAVAAGATVPRGLATLARPRFSVARRRG